MRSEKEIELIVLKLLVNGNPIEGKPFWNMRGYLKEFFGTENIDELHYDPKSDSIVIVPLSNESKT